LGEVANRNPTRVRNNRKASGKKKKEGGLIIKYPNLGGLKGWGPTRDSRLRVGGRGKSKKPEIETALKEEYKKKK